MPSRPAPKPVKPVYLRGIPSEVVREAKAAAARRGITLAGFVADTLAKALRETGSAGTPAPHGDDLSAEMRWFERNRDRLRRDYEGEYIAVIDDAVIDHDLEFDALAQRVFARAGARNVFMPRVESRHAPSGTPKAAPKSGPLRVRSPRVQRSR
ncbi:MAG TPA: hypothetical protein VGI70_00480 [Polyangiales bacterium]|jgi:hypothetical protein